MLYNTKSRRGVAQFGSALGSGPRGRGFKSRRLNQKIQYIADVLYFFIVSALRRDLRVGAVLRELNALPYEAWETANLTAKSAIDNCRAGRAAKGASPVASTKNNLT